MKNNSWPEVSLGNYIDLLTGFPFKSAKYVDDPDEIRLLRGDNIVQGTLRWDNCKRWTSTEIKQFSKYSLEFNDVVLAMDRPWIEAGLKWAYIKKSDLPCLLVQRVSRLRGKNGFLTNYIRYIVSDINFTNYVKSVITGINIPHISGQQIQAYRFRLPPVENQQKITYILSNYDDLIENNTRRIEILEQMAKLIYEEWFVKFRFPGHENVKMVPSELGEIPEGWKVKTLVELGKIITGKTPSTKNEDYYGDYIPFIKTPDMHGNMFCISSSQYLSKMGEASQKNKTLPENTLLVSCIGTVGVVSITSIESQTNQQINALIPNKSYELEYLYFELKKLKAHLENLGANGATLTNVNKEKFQSIKIIHPDNNIVKSFHEIVSPIFSRIKILQYKNQNLRKTRDLLLPKLISGEIDVSDLDIRIRNEFQGS